MSSLETRKIEPQTGTTVTLGAGGDTVLVSANQLKTNTVKDAGGNTLFKCQLRTSRIYGFYLITDRI